MRYRASSLLLCTGFLFWACTPSNLPSPLVSNCTSGNISAALSGCQFVLPGDVVYPDGGPINAGCMTFDGGAEALLAGNYGVQACQNEQAGLVVQCIADNVAECQNSADAGLGGNDGGEVTPDAGSLSALTEEQCVSAANPAAQIPSGDCVASCQSARLACETMNCSIMSVTTAEACFNCSFNCGSAEFTCVSACTGDAG